MTKGATPLAKGDQQVKTADRPEMVGPPAGKPNISYQEKKETERVLRRLQKRVNEAEAQITETELEIAAMDARLASGDPEIVSDPAFYASYEEKKQRLEALMEQWENAHTELESFKEDYMSNNDTV
jgi:ATP-binding cassette subfamily F protein 3